MTEPKHKTNPEDSVLLDALAQCVGEKNVVTEKSAQQPFTSDWTHRFHGSALAVVLPSSVEEVSAVMKLANLHCIPVVPQSGNTSLCGGGIPDESGRTLMLSTRRLNNIRQVQVESRVATVEAGVILQQLQDVLAENQLFFPLDLGAKGSCMIGGNLSTNAGGSNVLRYGNARELCLGLEVVLPDGQIMNLLGRLRKDNTGYDLKDLFIGAEGTLGIITAATLKLYPEPAQRHAAWLSVASPADALDTLNHIQDFCAGQLEAFEIMSRTSVENICHYVSGVTQPFSEPVDYVLLAQVSSTAIDDQQRNAFESALSTLYEKGTVLDAALANNETQRRQMWKLREGAAEANTAAGPSINADISLPLHRIQTFVDRMEQGLPTLAPHAEIRFLGHLGDGNLHYTVALRPNEEWDSGLVEKVNALIFDNVIHCEGSISAEHGIGQSKREQLVKYKDPVALTTMRAIKDTLDPKGIMNPGKILLP